MNYFFLICRSTFYPKHHTVFILIINYILIQRHIQLQMSYSLQLYQNVAVN